MGDGKGIEHLAAPPRRETVNFVLWPSTARRDVVYAFRLSVHRRAASLLTLPYI